MDNEFIHSVNLQKMQKGGKSSKNKGISSTLDLYDIARISEKQFDKVVKKSNKNIQSTIKNIQKLVADLRKNGTYVEIIPLPLSKNGIYWSDYADDFMSEKYGNAWYDNFIYFTIYMNEKGDKIESRNIGVSYSNLMKDGKIRLIKLLDKHLPSKYDWNGSNNRKIMISYEKVRTEKINLKTLKDDDFLHTVTTA